MWNVIDPDEEVSGKKTRRAKDVTVNHMAGNQNHRGKSWEYIYIESRRIQAQRTQFGKLQDG